ncbi:hypothetical protein HYDPIDRAFT_31663 [Hydnomerulius pinastri MD-312]|uniref:Unplaced genomic scaffold scaffold_31, whole genome shotgun sequence n=1 Tax=Hydnomerulius pinastri MD-312 TaxID=994086 RepID=A0A0C9V6C9_9AGAM|nr:hypothetical protein HYDPIDRAFT_31663 [Hydnomerulius pinastri MD-312]
MSNTFSIAIGNVLQLHPALEHPTRPNSVSTSSDAHYLVAAGSYGKPYIWSLQDIPEVKALLLFFDDKQIAVIEFFSPVTVIVGHNGGGKTTIIECLKYATTGDQPPNTRGEAFIHDPKMANEKEVKAQVKSRFHAANGTWMLATLEGILALADYDVEKGGKRGAISTKCAETDAEISHLLGVSKSVLENVIFCHQEDSYWPLTEPAALKNKFNDIFEATRYTKALGSIKSLRKDRVADLKADKERLESLSKEKAHADKLRSRVVELNSSITSKQLQYEECKAQYEELVKNNARFYESAMQFRELYVKVENLQQKKEHYQQELADAKESVTEIEGSDGDIQSRLRNFDEKNLNAKSSRTNSPKPAGPTSSSDKHNIDGYSHSPLEWEKVNEFISRLGDLQRRQRDEYEKLQGESRAKNDEYNSKPRELHTEKDKQAAISKAESSVKTMESLASELRTLAGDIEEKKLCLEMLKSEIKNANYDERLGEHASKVRNMEDNRESLNTELRGLSLQADARARLDLKRGEMKSRAAEVKNTKLVGTDARAKTMEREIDRISREKEQELAEAENESAAVNKMLQIAETTLSQAKAQLKTERDELKDMSP